MLVGSDRLLLGERNADDRLDALEAVLPRHDEPDGCAVLGRQDFVVQPDGQDGQRVHGFVHSKAFSVGPVERQAPAHRHPNHVVVTGEGDEARLLTRLAPPDEAREGKADPRDHHRPAFNTPMTVDPLLERLRLDDVFEGVRPRLAARSVNGDDPR